MKRNAVKSFSTVVLVLILIFSTMCTSFAETIQDNVEAWLDQIVNDYNNADTEEEKASIQERLNAFLEESGLDEVDLGSLADTDIGQIVGDITSGSGAMDDFFSLASDAWSSGIAMIKDVFNKGLGTSDGSNTATTKPSSNVTSPNIIIADTNKDETTTKAVGVPSITPAETTTQETTTYNVGSTTAPNLIGSGVVATEPVSSANIADAGIPVTSIIVLVVLTVATLAVIIAIVVFFVLKRK